MQADKKNFIKQINPLTYIMFLALLHYGLTKSYNPQTTLKYRYLCSTECTKLLVPKNKNTLR